MVPNVKFEVLNVMIIAFIRRRQHATPRCWQISMRLHDTTPQKRTVYISPLTIQWNNTYLYTVLWVDNQTTNWNSKWDNLLDTTRVLQDMSVDELLFPILEIYTAIKHSW